MAGTKLTPVEKTAYHEAGHAVMCYLLGRGFTKVTIKPDPESDYLGCVFKRPIELRKRVRDPWTGEIEYLDEPDESKAERELQIGMGGIIAEKLASGRANWVGAQFDFSHIGGIDDLILRVHSDLEVRSAYFRYLWHKTRAQLEADRIWRAVEALVKALLERQTLSGKQTREIIRAEFRWD